MLSFDAASIDDIIRQGYANTLEHKEEFEKIARLTRGWKAPRNTPSAINIAQQEVRVGRVLFEGISEREKLALVNPIFLEKDGMYGREDIQEVLAALYGTRAFESVTYRLEGDKEPYTLIFDCQKGQTCEFGAGLHIDLDEFVYADGFIGLGTRKLTGPRFVSEFKIGNNTSVSADFSYKPYLRLPVIGVAAKGTYNSVKYHNLGQEVHYSAVNLRLDAYVEDTQMIYGRTRIGVSTEFEPFEDFLGNQIEWRGWDFRSRWHSLFIDSCFDTFDDRYFPNDGYRFALRGRYVFGGYSTYLEEEGANTGEHTEGPVPKYASGVASFAAAVPLGGNFTLLPSVYFGAASAYAGQMNFVHTIVAGGTQAGRYMDFQIPFFGYTSGFYTCGRFGAMAEVDLRYRFARQNYLTFRSGALQCSESFGEIFRLPDAFAVAFEYGRKTVAGPLNVGLTWCSHVGVGVIASFGFVF